MFTTHGASPLTFAKGQSLVDIAALMAGLGTGVPPVHLHDFLSIQGSLVHEHGLEPARLSALAPKASVSAFHHKGNSVFVCLCIGWQVRLELTTYGTTIRRSAI